MRWLAILMLLAGFAQAQPDSARQNPVQHFISGSMQDITGTREGRPFVLAFWSVSCAHCPKELRALGDLQRNRPQLDIVLVATDTPEESALAAQLAAGYGLGDSEQWVFADRMPERLRNEIDKRWHGELPRTYFFDRQHRAQAVSGVVPAERLRRWAEANVP